jgi:20S proteasome alpha/beta subunit
VPVEGAVRRVTLTADPSGSLVVAIRCRQGTAVVSSLSKSPYLYDPADTETNATTTAAATGNSTSTNVSQSAAPLAALLDATNAESWSGGPPSPFCRLGPRLFGVAAGSAVDAQLARHRLGKIAHGYFLEGYAPSVPARAVARQWADECHYRTLQDGADDARILACASLVLDGDEVWRVEPSGQLYLCRAAAAGRGAPRAEAILAEALAHRAAAGQNKSTEEDGRNNNGSDPKEDSDLTLDADGSVSGDQQIRRAILSLSLEEALAMATRTVLATLRRPSAGDAGDGPAPAAVRVLGLTLGRGGAEWHDQDRLLRLMDRNERES